MQDNNLILLIEALYSNKSDFDEFTRSAYVLLNDVIHCYDVKYFSFHTINVLGKFLSYILRHFGTVDYLNIKCIETLKHLFTNNSLSIKLKNLLIYVLELDIASNLLKKESEIDQHTWDCICCYIIHCKNIAPAIRILISVGVLTISSPVEHKRCIIKLHHLIYLMTKYKIDFYEIVMTLKLLIEKSKVLDSRIKSFCLNIMQLIYWCIDRLDYQNGINYIQSQMFHTLNNIGDFSQVKFVPYNWSVNNNEKISEDIFTDYSTPFNEFSIASKQSIMIPINIHYQLYNRRDHSVQLKGIEALRLFTWKMFCGENSFQFYPNLKCYIKNIRIFLTNILNIMHNQSANMIFHLSDVVLMLLHYLPNYVIEANTREIFQLFNPILTNNLKPMHQTIHRILLQLLRYFKPDVILDELWIYSKNTNFRIRTNALYCMAFILNNLSGRNIDTMKMIERIVQCLKDKSGAVQSAAAECCAILVGLNNTKYNASILYMIENLLLNEISIMEVHLLLEKIKKFIQKKDYNENFNNLTDLPEFENDVKHNYIEGIHQLDCKNYTLDKSVSQIPSKTFDILEMSTTQLDSNKDNHFNGSYLHISEHRKRLKSHKPDVHESLRRCIDTVKTYDFSTPNKCQSDHVKSVNGLPYIEKAHDELTTMMNTLPDIQSRLSEEEINCPVNWYNGTTENQIYRGLESLRYSVSRRRKQWLFNQLAKMNVKKLSASNHDQEEQIIPGQRKSKYSSSYKEGIKSDSHVIKKSVNRYKLINKPVTVEKEIIEYITSDNWEEQIKAADIIQNLLETMNVKSLEILFSNPQHISMLVRGIEQTVTCLRSQVSLKGLKTIRLLCNYLNAIKQGHLFNSHAEVIITTLLGRISEDSSTKFLRQESYKSLEAFISCIDEAIAVQIMCTNSWDKFMRSNIRRNTIGQMLEYIFCKKLQTGKKSTILFKRLGVNGMEHLLKVVHQLTNDKVSSTRLCGRRILEQLTLITDITKVNKHNTVVEN
ncbi:unnamed protein product [Schistosoma turkestanicum]|nr:unnamed protein product [Schistosoma turkestanicum]